MARFGCRDRDLVVEAIQALGPWARRMRPGGLDCFDAFQEGRTQPHSTTQQKFEAKATTSMNLIKVLALRKHKLAFIRGNNKLGPVSQVKLS